MRALRALLAGQPAVARSIPEQREADRAEAANTALPPDTRVETVTLGGVPALRVRSGRGEGPVIAHFHAGAYVYRSAFEYRAFGGALANAAAAEIALIDYRLAPEHVFPAAFEDGLSSYRALLDRGTPPQRLILSGDSAGGGLVLAITAAARDRGWPLPAGLVLMSPWTDLTCSSDSYRVLASADPRVTRDVLLANAKLYLAGADPRDPRASPAFASMAGLPPTLIMVGSDEVMLGDSLVTYGAMRAADCQVRLEVWPDMIHVWHRFADRLSDGRRAIERLASFARERWGHPST